MSADNNHEETTRYTAQQMVRIKAAGDPGITDDPAQVHRHTITMLLENSIGAMMRVVNMFSARGFNLESVSVGQTDNASISRMNIVTTGNDLIIKQVLRQLNRLVDALHVEDLTGRPFVERELALLRVRYTAESRSEIMGVSEIFRGKVVDITTQSITFELTGPGAKIDAFINLMRKHGIVDVARSGRVAMLRATPDAVTAHEEAIEPYE